MSQDPSCEFAPGDRIERYEIQSVLGRGGMAVVYRAVHTTLETVHALKVLTIPSPQIRKRLVQEGKVQAQLRHPNVVAVTDVLDVDGAPGLLMECIDGPSMDGWLQINNPDLALAEEIFLGVLAGVEKAHALGIVHRDLKPGNVMMARDGDHWVPKVTDFGLAKAVLGDPSASATRSGLPMGTPSYMSPEQVRDAKNVDHRTDVFALGCILYELVVGRRAFSGGDTLEVFNAVASGRFEPPSQLVTDLPQRFIQAINGALAVDRDRRIDSCESLRKVMQGEESWVPQTSAMTLDWSFGDDEPPEGVREQVSIPAAAAAPRPPAGAPGPAATVGMTAAPLSADAAAPRPPAGAPLPSATFSFDDDAAPLPPPATSSATIDPVGPSGPIASATTAGSATNSADRIRPANGRSRQTTS